MAAVCAHLGMWLGGGAAALAATDSLDAATDACRAGLCLDAPEIEKKAIRNTLHNITKKRRAALCVERAFCARMFA